MPGNDLKYKNKQKHQRAAIEEDFEERGVPVKDAERRAAATVNVVGPGGEKSGFGRGKTKGRKRGSELSDKAAAGRPAAERAASARKAGARAKG